jgi:4-hydroxy-tetrahydrodipicolinate synthase
MGGHGDISVTANVAPRLMSEMCAAAIAGDSKNAATIDMSLVALHSALFLEANPIPVKWAVYKMGFMENALRLPMTTLSAAYQDTVVAALSAAGITK